MADKDFVVKHGLVVGDTATINGVQIDLSNATSGQVLKFDGTKFVPASEGDISGTVYSATIGDGTNSSYVITHNLGTRDVVVVVRNAASPYEVINARWEAETANTVVLDFSVAPSSSSVRVGVYATVSGTAVTTIDDLGDVTITSSTTGDLLKWNGSAWVNAAGYATLASPTFTGNVSGITKTMVGLGSVDNTADTAKPVSTAQQTALDLKANLASPALTGTPTAPTANAATNTTQIATTAFVRAEVAALVNSAGSTLDTLGEIATALGNDANLSTTLTTSIGLKAPLASPTFTGTVTIPAGASISGFAPLASPSLTGTPLAPTAAGGTNTTQIATTAFVTTAVSGATITSLDDVSDVTITSAASGQVLQWSGSAWINATVSTDIMTDSKNAALLTMDIGV